MSASVYSGTPTPVPGRRGTMRDAHGADEYGAARRGIHQNTRSNAHTADCATLSPARRGPGKSTRVVDASLTVDTFVLPARIMEPARVGAPIGPGGREASRAIVENVGDCLTV
jgi:hypothetical protein